MTARTHVLGFDQGVLSGNDTDWSSTKARRPLIHQQLPGTTFADAVMVELRDIRAALFMEQTCAFQPFSRAWLERTLGIGETDHLFLLEADQNLPAEIREGNLPFVDWSAGKTASRRTALRVFGTDGIGRQAR